MSPKELRNSQELICYILILLVNQMIVRNWIHHTWLNQPVNIANGKLLSSPAYDVFVLQKMRYATAY